MSSFAEKAEAAGLEPKIAFIGGGNMTQALVLGFINAKLVPASNILVTNPSQAKLESLKKLGVRTFEAKENAQVVKEVANGFLILSVKPHILPGVLKELKAEVLKCKLVISLAAGISISSLRRMVGGSWESGLVRVMPTMAAAVCASATGITRNDKVSDSMVEAVGVMLKTVGSCHEVPEYQINALNGLIAPGHAFTIMDAMADGAVKMGLPRPLAMTLAAETLAGAAKLYLETGKHPGELKNAVCSPGGTTIAGIHAMEKAGLRAAIMDGIEASALRSRELDNLDEH